MTVNSIFGKLQPTPWSEARRFSSLDRARRFFVPGLNDAAHLKLAQRLIGQGVRGKMMEATLKHEFLKKAKVLPEGLGAAYRFYTGLFSGARNAKDDFPTDPDSMYAGLVYHGEGCCARCVNLAGRFMAWAHAERRQ